SLELGDQERGVVVGFGVLVAGVDEVDLIAPGLELLPLRRPRRDHRPGIPDGPVLIGATPPRRARRTLATRGRTRPGPGAGPPARGRPGRRGGSPARPPPPARR